MRCPHRFHALLWNDNSGETSANDSGNMTIFNENAKVGEEDAWSF